MMTIISKETAQQWMSEAEADERIKPILQEVEAKYAVNVRRIDEDEWHSKINGNDAEVGIAKTNRPLASFYP